MVLSSHRIAMGKFSPTKPNGDCEVIANPSTAYGRRRRNWIDAHGSVPAGQVVDASCGNRHCIALRHSYVRYFGAAADDPKTAYYSYDLGDWHIIALNSECDTVGGCGAGSAQEQWLRQDLKDHQVKCTLA
jgi:hypothetical protein